MDTISSQGVSACWAVFLIGCALLCTGYTLTADNSATPLVRGLLGLLGAVCIVAVMVRVLPLVFT